MLTQRSLQRGATIVELMVGLTVGFVVLMLITRFFLTELTSNTELLKVTRLNQELRSVMDLTVRDLRRGAYWGNAISGVWYEGSTGVVANPLQSITVGTTVDPAAALSGSSITYSYDVGSDGALNGATDTFTIQLTGDTVELVQAGLVTPLSDTRSTAISALTFAITPAAVTVSCVGTGSNPILTVREIAITLTGNLKDDPTVTRTLRETVRMRGDNIAGSCPPVIT
jgi:prepilin peptidase dependent protein B